MNISELISQLRSAPQTIEFAKVIEVIDAYYDFSPTAFDNGETRSEAGQNNGSCKLFFFAKLQDLNEQETLHLFGHYYRVDVLEHPELEDHANIRNFMRQGWQGISFEGIALEPKA